MDTYYDESPADAGSHVLTMGGADKGVVVILALVLGTLIFLHRAFGSVSVSGGLGG